MLIPACRPPHKRAGSISDAHHRYAMAAIATLDQPRLIVSAIELESPDRPYTFETLERLKEIYGSRTNLFFVMGADSFLEINSWREPERLFSNASVIVAARPGCEITTSHLYAGREANVVDMRGRDGATLDMTEGNESRCLIYLIDYVNSDVSSTDIRQRVEEDQAIDGLVPSGVAQYIEKYELYRR